MKIHVLAVNNNLAEKHQYDVKCFKKEKNLKIMFFLEKKNCNFQIEKKWKLIAYYDSAYPI